MWENNQYHHYTKHDIAHSNSILEKLNNLLIGQNICFKPIEEFILLASIYLHDIGMLCIDTEIFEKVAPEFTDLKYPFGCDELEEIRKFPHIFSFEMIKKNNYLNNTICFKNEISNNIALLCKAHCDKEENFPTYCLEEIKNVPGSGPINLKLLAVLLRLGDALDCDASKVCSRKISRKN